MDPKTEKLLNSLKSKRVGVFCDDSNLYHSYKKYGWRINFEKFRKLLEGYCDLKFIHYHIAIPDKSDDVFRGTKNYVIKDKRKNILFIGYEENMAWELRQCWHLYLGMHWIVNGK